MSNFKIIPNGKEFRPSLFSSVARGRIFSRV
jgi:hypothetical protein